ncbi:MAG: hypothetical protein LBL82_05205 [Oscillospiraceae bacterium]|jgi:hypothetical protein|nr:hypothetical protein [Oscillospiraceae bacterium]
MDNNINPTPDMENSPVPESAPSADFGSSEGVSAKTPLSEPVLTPSPDYASAATTSFEQQPTVLEASDTPAAPAAPEQTAAQPQQPTAQYNPYAAQPQQPAAQYNPYAAQPQQPTAQYNPYAAQPQQPTAQYNPYAAQPQQPTAQYSPYVAQPQQMAGQYIAYVAQPLQKDSAKGAWALGLSITSILTSCCFGIPGLILSIIAIILGFKGYKESSGSGVALAGIIIGFIGLLASIVMTIAFIEAFREEYITGSAYYWYSV